MVDTKWGTSTFARGSSASSRTRAPDGAPSNARRSLSVGTGLGGRERRPRFRQKPRRLCLNQVRAIGHAEAIQPSHLRVSVSIVGLILLNFSPDEGSEKRPKRALLSYLDGALRRHVALLHGGYKSSILASDMLLISKSKFA